MAIEKELPGELAPNLLYRKDFMWDEKLDEPHVRRAAAILKAHPEVKTLFGYDPITKYVVFLISIVQFMLMAFVADKSWPVFLSVMYLFGAPLNHAASMAIHEITHGLAADSLAANYLLAIFVNLQLGVPSAMAFKKYHLEHHIYLGTDGYDTDLPTKTEAKIFTNDSKLKKFLWAFLLAGFYSIRPFIVRKRPFSAWELFNILVVVTSDVIIYKLFGGYAILYLLLSSYFGMGFHPCAGHLLHEHYITTEGQETYSYYGWGNEISFNVGYHNEHHDFPQVPYTRLPKIRQMAPEFYNNLATYDSMFTALWDFVMKDGYGLTNRIKRTIQTHNKARTEFADKLYKESKNSK